MLIIADRIKEYSSTVGTGNIDLEGAELSFKTFSSVCSTGDTFYYCIVHRNADEWEIGYSSYTADNKISRGVVLSSSNNNLTVNFTAGGKDVFITQPAATLDLLVRSTGPSILGSTSAGQTQRLTITEVKNLLNIQLSDVSNVISAQPNNRASNNSGVYVPEVTTDLVAIYNTAKQ